MGHGKFVGCLLLGDDCKLLAARLKDKPFLVLLKNLKIGTASFLK
jgi:hypothetical protein